jgi:predicted transcriptional regulator
MPSMTAEQKTEAKRLRSTGMSYPKIGKAIGVSESGVFKYLTNRRYCYYKQPKSKKSEPKQAMRVRISPPIHHRLNSSCPTHKLMDPFYRAMPKPTREELERRLAVAWRNTAMLAL